MEDKKVIIFICLLSSISSLKLLSKVSLIGSITRVLTLTPSNQRL